MVSVCFLRLLSHQVRLLNKAYPDCLMMGFRKVYVVLSSALDEMCFCKRDKKDTWVKRETMALWTEAMLIFQINRLWLDSMLCASVRLTESS